MRKRIGQRFDGSLGAIVGSTFISRLNDHGEGAPLRIGSRSWSKHDLARNLGVAHTKAARVLTAAAESIGATTVRELYTKSSPYTFAGIGGLGETALYVLWRLFESEGFDPELWATAGGTEKAVVTFHTMKRREAAAEAAERKAERKRNRHAHHPHSPDAARVRR